MSLLLNHPEIEFGFEAIERAAIIQIKNGIQAQLDAQAAYWAEQDQAYADALGVPLDTITTVLEPIPATSYYTGHIPSLINAPPENYPNVAAMVPTATPASGSDQIDQGDAYENGLVIEVMVKSVDNADECNRRIKRMAEAVNNCMVNDPTLGGIISGGFDASPTAIISDCFVRKDKTSYGQKLFWQGARLEYAVRKEAMPQVAASTGSPIFRAAPPQFEGLEIDQA